MDLGAKRREIKNHEELVNFLNQLLLPRTNLTIGKVIFDIRCYPKINLGTTVGCKEAKHYVEVMKKSFFVFQANS